MAFITRRALSRYSLYKATLLTFLFGNLIVFIGYLVFYLGRENNDLLAPKKIYNNFTVIAAQIYKEIEALEPNLSQDETKSRFLKKLAEMAISLERKEIKRKMEGYQFQTDAVASSKDLIMEEGGEPIRNVICTSWRSGSTFVGGVVEANPATFYHYEPLMPFGVKQLRSKQEVRKGLYLLKNILNCNFSAAPELTEYGKTDRWPLNQNSRVFKYCKDNYELCLDPEFLSNMCRMFPFQSMRTTRMRLRVAKTLLEDPKFNIRLLFLIRDPRGTTQSRRKNSWCHSDHPDCSDSSRICGDMVDDFKEGEELRMKFPERFLAMRFEDLSLHPFEAFQKIYKFFRLQFHHPKVQKFISAHTKANDNFKRGGGGIPDTFRDTNSVPFHWREDFAGNFSLIEEIQRNCGEAMSLWGYETVIEESLLLKFNPLREPPWKEMLLPNSHTDYYKNV